MLSLVVFDQVIPVQETIRPGAGMRNTYTQHVSINKEHRGCDLQIDDSIASPIGIRRRGLADCLAAGSAMYHCCGSAAT